MKYKVKLINDKFLKISMLNDVQAIFKSVEKEDASIFDIHEAYKTFEQLNELKFKNGWEDYYPLGIINI